MKLWSLTPALLLATLAGVATAQPFPAKPIRVIVPYAAGGAVDAMMRRVGPSASESLGQPVVVDNRPGALGVIGMQACAGAPPDGYTLCFSVEDPVVYNPLLFTKLPYDAAGLIPVTVLATARAMIVAKADAPFGTFKEMLAYAKANPRKVNWGTWGPATLPDLYRQWIGRTAGAEFWPIPYKGVGAGTMPALLAGEIDVSIFTIGQIHAQLQAGKARPIAILGDQRSALLPGVATLGEEGVEPGLPAAWAVYAPAGTPAALVERLNDALVKALAAPPVRELMQANTLEPIGSAPAESARFIAQLRSNAERVFRTLGIKPTDQPG